MLPKANETVTSVDYRFMQGTEGAAGTTNYGTVSDMSLSQSVDFGAQRPQTAKISAGATQMSSQAAIMTNSLQNRLNALESKYMDLANYYKCQTNTQLHLGSQSSDGQTSAVGGVVSNLNSNYQGNAAAGIQLQPSQIHTNGAARRQEEDIIRDLQHEKLQFEMELKDFATSNTANLETESPAFQQRQLGRKTLRDEELVRFNMELKGAFKDILDSIDSSQEHQMDCLS